MTIKVSIIGENKLAHAGDSMVKSRRKLADDLFKACQKFSWESVQRSQRDYLSGPRPEKLGHVTGDLSASMAQKVDRDDDGFTITIGNKMVYAPIHEFGGFTGRGGKTPIPARPFIRPGIDDAKPNLESDITHILAMYRVEGVGDGE